MTAPDASREALPAGLLAGRFAGRALTLVAEATRDAIAQTPQPGDEVLDGVARFVTEGPEAAMPALRDALQCIRGPEWASTAGSGSLWLAGRAAGLAWDFDTWQRCSVQLLMTTRAAGHAAMLPSALTDRAATLLLTGALGGVASLAAEESAAIEAAGGRVVPYSELGLAAFTGRDTQARYLILAGSQDAHRRGDGAGVCFINWAAAVLYNGLGRYEDAYAAAADTANDQPAQRYRNWTLAELIEAAVRTGRHAEATAAMHRLDEVTLPSGSHWARGVRARCSALLAAGDCAEAAYLEAIAHLQRTPLLPEVARTHLLFGDWLRRERRAVDAREHLRHAAGAFEEMGMPSFARRARLELAAAGDVTGPPSGRPCAGLTAREDQISRLVAEGASNAEIATRLFITHRTVEYHLHKVFRKLAVTSRTQLARLVIDDDGGGAELGDAPLPPRVAS
jgi:DNA-binding CsgD family transcriptional regulator